MPAMTTTAAAVPALSGYQKWVIALLAFLQFTIILDFMVISPLGALLMPALKITPAQFFREVRQEAAKVTWPTRKETAVTTAMVFVMVFLAAMLTDLSAASISSAVILPFLS